MLIIKKGRCEIDIYSDERELIATRELKTGDIMLMISGGHGFRMLEDTILIKSGRDLIREWTRKRDSESHDSR